MASGRGGTGGRPGRRKPSSKKGPTVGSGGQRRKALEGRGPTPKAEERPHHPAARRASAAAKRAQQPGRRPQRRSDDAPELLVGRNPVVEAMRAGVPGTGLYVASNLDHDERVSEAVQRAADRGISILEVSKVELDRMTGGLLHQGLALQVPPYSYAHPDDVLNRAIDSGRAALIVALDSVMDPRNLGAVVRSAAAFGAHGLVIPERRAAGMTASAWRTSAGAAARLPIARATNLTRTLVAYRKAGLLIVGLDAKGGTSIHDLPAATEPLVLVAGSEGKGMSRLVGETCDVTVSIPITSDTESLNAGVAMSVALAEVARRRRG
ncbi:MAG: 23S rRNA (guanosine(2251)-2'-O)-methyltransferase RlmB [Geodermatophilaceae bacterium]|nr:23S rRNA (guanosine(2251)-2'-O)-methyltransferase RlmB [Geodermatophilaceae bacterium]